VKLVDANEAAAIRKCLTQSRKRQGVTQARLAHYLGLPQSWISKVETGQRRLDIGEFLLVANGIRIEPRDLIDEILRAVPSLRTRLRRRPAK
jgi:transcriptional regulator with XRE-family HTH domain